MPDMEKDPVISSNWPLQLSKYTREKKLIRDVSGKTERYRQRYANLSNSTQQKQPYQIKRISRNEASNNGSQEAH